MRVSPTGERVWSAEENALHVVLQTSHGRGVMWQLLGDARTFGTTFTGDALTSAFNEGRRSLGVELLAMIMLVDEQAFPRMQGEARVRDEHAMREAEIEAETQENL